MNDKQIISKNILNITKLNNKVNNMIDYKINDTSIEIKNNIEINTPIQKIINKRRGRIF